MTSTLLSISGTSRVYKSIFLAVHFMKAKEVSSTSNENLVFDLAVLYM